MTTTLDILDCGHERTPEGCAYGTAHTTDGRTICLRCAEREEIENLKTSPTIVAYVTDGNRQVTTWTGAKLGTVTSRTVSRGRWSNYGIVHRHYVRVTDVHGGHWHGSGPVENGQYVTLHRSKGG